MENKEALIKHAKELHNKYLDEAEFWKKVISKFDEMKEETKIEVAHTPIKAPKEKGIILEPRNLAPYLIDIINKHQINRARDFLIYLRGIGVEVSLKAVQTALNYHHYKHGIYYDRDKNIWKLKDKSQNTSLSFASSDNEIIYIKKRSEVIALVRMLLEEVGAIRNSIHIRKKITALGYKVNERSLTNILSTSDEFEYVKGSGWILRQKDKTITSK